MLSTPSSAFISDYTDLSQAGWGVIFANEDRYPEIRAALAPLLDHRRQASSPLYCEYVGGAGYVRGDSIYNFLAKHGMGPGLADPKRVPLYLLIVGSPEEIPFDFQYQLGVQYRVGRIHFDTLESYSNYAVNVLAAEVIAPKPKVGVFFSPDHSGDPSTRLSVEHLAEPLAINLSRRCNEWTIKTLLSEYATKANLHDLFLSEPTPAFLFVAAHGVDFLDKSSRPYVDPGAILCSDWPGRWSGWPRKEHFFCADDVPREANLTGMIFFHFGCYSAGISAEDVFPEHEPSQHFSAAPKVSYLAQKLLGKAMGASALIGHVDRAWQTSFYWPLAGPQLQTFETSVLRILNGLPVGLALECLTQRYAELAAELSSSMWLSLPTSDEMELIRNATIDAKKFILIGDPAARPLQEQTQGKARRKQRNSPPRLLY